MAKDVNIHIKTMGASQTEGDLKGVGRATQEVGDNVQAMGEKSRTGFSRFIDGIKNMVGPLGFAAVLGIVAKTAEGISSFFDTLKKRCDEAVQNLMQVRASFEDLFEAMNAFDERSRKQISVEAAELLKETRVPMKLGVPVITSYARQFRSAVETGQITEEQYREGLVGMLGYAARHGQEATPELITLMAGWRKVTPQQQGALRRQITELSGGTGLTDEDIISILGRAMPTINAMGWSPEQALSKIGVLAAGEIGKTKLSLPASTLEALTTPDTTDLKKKYGISEDVARNPQALFAQVALKSRKMDRQATLDMLRDIYGPAAPGVYKLMSSSDEANIVESLKYAAGPEGAAEEAEEEAKSRETFERVQAQTDATILKKKLGIESKEFYENEVRRFGSEQRDLYRRKQPFRQAVRERFIWSEEEEKESAAMRAWWDSLSPGEQKRILDQYQSNTGYWESLSPRERYDTLNRLEQRQSPESPSQPPQPVNIHYHNEVQYFPSTGDRLIGPRADRTIP